MNKKGNGFCAGGWMGCLFLLILWQILLWAQNPSLMSDDSGEMIAAAYRLGITHPPGYPLFCLVGRLFSFIPVGTIAFRLNLLSTVFVLFSFCFIGWACLDFLKIEMESPTLRRVGWSALYLMLFFLFACRSVFAQALTAKGCVYTLTLLFLSVLLWLRIKSHQEGFSFAQSLFAAWIWAVGLTNHWESEILWLPFILYWFYQEKIKWDIKRLCQAFSVVAIGLSLYLYLPLRSALGCLPAWGNPQTLSGFLWVVSRKPFRGLEHFLKNSSYYVSFFEEYLHIQLFYWIPGFVVLVVIGLYYLHKHYRELFYSTLIFYIPVVAAILLVPRPETKFLISVYLVSTQGLVAFWGFVGIFIILRKLRENGSRKWLLTIGLFFLAGSFWTWRVFKKENKSQYYLASDFGINALKLLPSRSIFLAEGDNYVMPIFYERFVENLRKDLVFIPSIFLFHNWGWQQLSLQDPSVALAIESAPTFNGRLKALTRIGAKRDLFYTLDQTYLGSDLGKIGGYWIPWALEERWVATRPRDAWVAQRGFDLVREERWRGVGTAYNPGDITTFEIHHYYANQFFSTGKWLRSENDLSDALRYFDAGIRFYPQAAYAYSDMAAILGSEGYLELSRRLSLMGIEANPGYFTNYSNLANVYFLQGEDLKARECFYWAQEHVSDSRLVENGLRALAQREQNKNRWKMKDKSPRQYHALGNWFKAGQMFFLSSLADQIAGVPLKANGG